MAPDRASCCSPSLVRVQFDGAGACVIVEDDGLAAGHWMSRDDLELVGVRHGSIEELVYSRQIYKQQLLNISVNGTFEKRYFEGVQDSKIHKGELFGISNLFRDLSETVFTSDIIEKHDERITGIHRSSSGAVEGNNNKSIVRIEEADFEDINNS